MIIILDETVGKGVNGHFNLHWVRDNTFDEDCSQARTGTTPHVLVVAHCMNLSHRLTKMVAKHISSNQHGHDPQYGDGCIDNPC